LTNFLVGRTWPAGHSLDFGDTCPKESQKSANKRACKFKQTQSLDIRKLVNISKHYALKNKYL